MSAAPRVLIIRRRYLGDIVLLGPVLRNLRLHWPQARLSVMCEAAYAPILSLNADVDEAIPFPRHAFAWPGTIARLRRAEFTHVLDLDNRDKTALLTWTTGAAVRVTERHGERLHFPSLYTSAEVLPVSFLEQRHITDLYLHGLQKMGVPDVSRSCRLHPRAADLALIRELLGEASILVHPGSRSAWRIWPAANFAAVIDHLQGTLNLRVALVAGPGEQQTVTDICRHARTPVRRIEQKLSVTQLAALLAAVDVLLCHDSGPMHVAAAVGTRVIALFGSQPQNIWRPLGERHVTLQPPLPCVNCVAPGKCAPSDSYHNYCVRNITVERVIAAVQEGLAEHA